MFSRIARFIAALFIIIVIALLLRDDTRAYLKDRLFSDGNFSKIHDLDLSLDNLKQDVRDMVEQMPAPLVSKLGQKEGVLQANVIIERTNDVRITHGLSALSINGKLSQAALAKVDDMFTYQYFEHDSPQGKTPSTFVKGAGYEYLTIGENLALGIFEDEKDLVTAWMNSPGHRANILGEHFTEIGVAAKRGLFKGEQVWLAVQEFGRPLSLCPKPDESLKAQIERDSATAAAFSKAMAELRTKIESTSKNDDSYNQYINEYNKLVNQYNALIKDLASRGEAYNKAAKIFNECVKTSTN
jgi:hypothetical protein